MTRSARAFVRAPSRSRPQSAARLAKNVSAKIASKPVETGVQIKGLDRYVLADILQKTLASIKEEAASEMKDALRTAYLERREKGLQVECKGAKATLSFRKRPKNRDLTDEDIQAFGKMGIPLRHQPKKIVVNEKYVEDQDVLLKLVRLLQGNPGVLPPDFLKTTKPTLALDETTIERVINAEPEVASALFERVGSLVVTKGELDVDEEEIKETIDGLFVVYS